MYVLNDIQRSIIQTKTTKPVYPQCYIVCIGLKPIVIKYAHLKADRSIYWFKPRLLNLDISKDRELVLDSSQY